jgi:hypothetical protein
MADDAEPPTLPVTFIDNPHAPEVFASRVAGFFNFEGNIVIAFESARVDHSQTPGPVNRVVIARLVMPASGAHGLAVGLFDFMRQQGFELPAPEGSTPHRPN